MTSLEGSRHSVEHTAADPTPNLLVQTFVQLADTLVREFDVVDFLHTLADRSVPLVGVASAGVMLTDQRGALRVVAASDERAETLELFELQSDEGPCLDAFAGGKQVHSTMPEALGRWPRFARAAQDAGYQGLSAVPMRLRADTIGALNLFRYEADPLSSDERRTAQALADVATIGLLQQRAISDSRLLAEQLQYALTSRVTLEQAKGMVAERAAVSVDEAFVLLRRYARRQGHRLGDVAAAVLVGDLAMTELRGG